MSQNLQTVNQNNNDGEHESNQFISSCVPKLNSLLTSANKANMKYIEDFCKIALQQIQEESKELEHERIHTSAEMIQAGLSPMDINFNIRFSRKWNPSEKLKKSSSIFNLGAPTLAPSDYESITSEAILLAPIRDICLVQRNDTVPEGFYRISKTPLAKKADLNTGSGGNHLYLCIKKDNNQNDIPPITAVVVLYPDRKESVPPGFSVVKRNGKPCNLNAGTNAERIYLCCKRDSLYNPIIDLVIYFPSKSESLPISFTRITRSVRNHPVDLNSGTGAQPIALCVKYTCSNLNFLVPNNNDTPEKSEYSPQDLLINKEDTDALMKLSRKSLDRRLSAQSSLGMNDENKDDEEAGHGRAHSHSHGHGHGPSPSPSASANANATTDKIQKKADGDTDVEELFDDVQSETKTPKFLADESPSESIQLESRSYSAIYNSERPSQSDLTTTRNLTTSNLQEMDHEARRESDVTIPEATFLLDDDNVSVGGQSVIDFEPTSPRTRQGVVNNLDEPIPTTYGYILRAFLSGLFSTGDVVEITLEILNSLVTEETLFQSDFLGHSPSDGLMMLDVVISSLCERLDWCGETLNNKILELIHTIIVKTNGKLSKLATQLIFRGTLFVCSTYSSRLDWILAGSSHPLLEDGKDVYSFLVLKQLIKSIVQIAELSPVEHFLPATPLNGEEEGDYYNLGYLISYGESFILVSDIVTQFIDEVMEAVEISRVTEATLLCATKKNSNILSPSFWVQINELSLTLFRSYELQNAFILLVALCKWSWMEVKLTPNGDISPRHLGNKLFTIEAIREFCRSSGPQVRASKIMGYQVRRMVVSVIFTNMQYSMSQPRIFLKLIQLVSCIWENWREHIRLEFPVLCEQLIIKILQAPTSKMPPLIHLIALIEIMKWFEQPHMLVEMFVNFDMDLVVAADWNIFSHLIRAVCAFAEKASRPVVPGGPPGPFPSEASSVGSLGTMFGAGYIPVQVRDVRIKALEVVATITRAMMDATGHANLIYMDIISHDDTTSSNHVLPDSSDNHDDDMDGGDSSSMMTPGQMKRRISYSITHRRAISLHSAELLQQSIKIYHEKESVGKCVKFLVSKNFMSDTPHEIAGFVRIYKDSFDPVSIGDFLGEGGRNAKEEEYWNAIRYRYTRAVSFVDLHLADALRLYLTGCGFRMPGEAQKIDRFISAFVKVYWEDNRGTEFCPFCHEDTIHLLAYAIIMLNTDLHRANLDKKKGGKKMSKAEFIKNLRGADNGNDINVDYLSQIYDDIARTPIEMEVKDKDQSLLQKDGNNNGNDGTVTDMESHKRYVTELIKNLRGAGDLMRSLSPYTHMFHIVGVNISISMELVSFMFESVWHHFHAIVDGILTKMYNEENIIFSALDVLCNSLTSCIFLNLKVEKLAFATQLARFRQICEAANVDDLSGKSSVKGADFASGLFRQEKWFISVENSTAETAIAAIADVHSIVVQLKDLVRQCARREATKLVFARIEKRANLNDGVRFVIMEGDLKKKNRAGRYNLYRFFLFSDCIVYAHQLFSEYKVHGQLSLDSTSIEANVPDDANNCCFIIDNPTKSFVVMTESSYDKQLWVRSINDAIASCERRRRGRRLSILDRMESQEKEVTERQVLHETLASKAARPTNHQLFTQSSNVSNSSSSPRADSSDKFDIDLVQQRSPFQDYASPSQVRFDLPDDADADADAAANGDVVEGDGEGDHEFDHDSHISDDISHHINHDNDSGNDKNKTENENENNTAVESRIVGPHSSNEWIQIDTDTLESNQPTTTTTSTSTTTATTTRSRSTSELTNEDKVDQDDEFDLRIKTCSVYLSKLESQNLTKIFFNGLKRWKILLDSKAPVDEEIQLKLYGLYRLAKDGVAPPEDPTMKPDSKQYKQLKAWRECGSLSTNEAQMEFIVTLYSVSSDWDYTLS